MKTGRRILVIAGVVIFALMITSLVVFRKDVGDQIRARLESDGFRKVDEGPFHSLVFSGDWIVDIRQDSITEVQASFAREGENPPVIENVNGVLTFVSRRDTTMQTRVTKRVRISTETLRSILGDNGSVITIRNFAADSIQLILREGSTLTGEGNQFRNVSLQISGSVNLSMTNTPE